MSLINRTNDAARRTTDLNAALQAKIAFLDFAIDVLGAELDVGNTASFVHSEKSEDVNWEIPGAEPYEMRQEVPLTGRHIISRPWNSDRLLGAVISEAIYGHKPQDGNCDATLYEELNLVIINNGRHHQTVAKMKGQAFAKRLSVVSLKDHFDDISTDGTHWIWKKDGEDKKAPCPDYRLALLFSLAKVRYGLSMGNDIIEPDYANQKQTELKQSELASEIIELLHDKNKEIYNLKKENQLLRGHLNRLLKQKADAGILDEYLGTEI